MKFLVLNYMIYQYSGSEINALQICEELIRQGHEADIGALVIGSQMADEVRRHGIKLIDLNQIAEPLNYDVIWAHHSPVLAHVLFNTNISDCRILFSSLSWLAPLEAPPTFHQDIHQFLSYSEINTAAMIENGVSANNIVLFTNYAPKSFYQPVPANLPELKNIAIVSNHVPKELVDFSNLASENGITVKIIGLESQPTYVTKDVLNEFDLVITIGKTVFYCFAMGKPVYVYDHFGGPGYINRRNFQNNENNNYSGNGGYPKKSAEELFLDIVRNFEKNFIELQFLQELCRKHYDLEKNLSRVLGIIWEIPITEIDKFRKNHSLDKRVYASLDHINYWILTELEKTKVELSNVEQAMRKHEKEFHQQLDIIESIDSKELKILRENERHLEQLLNFANQEITSYYLSTSWKITRPFRWIGKKLKGGKYAQVNSKNY